VVLVTIQARLVLCLPFSLHFYTVSDDLFNYRSSVRWVVAIGRKMVNIPLIKIDELMAKEAVRYNGQRELLSKLLAAI
jgi:hypothetical protein